MADERDDERRAQGSYAELQRKLVGGFKDVNERLQSVDDVAHKALDLLEAQDERLGDVERTLWGHEDHRRREADPGLVHVVNELASAFKDVRAVAKAGWAMLALVGFSTVISLLSFFFRVGT